MERLFLTGLHLNTYNKRFDRFETRCRPVLGANIPEIEHLRISILGWSGC
jgi:hypothetical protein